MDATQWINVVYTLLIAVAGVLGTAFGWKWIKNAMFEKTATALKSIALDIVAEMSASREGVIIPSQVTVRVAAGRLADKDERAVKLTDSQRKVIIERAIKEL